MATIDRRQFLKNLGMLTAAACLVPGKLTASSSKKEQTLWKGFNLLNKFNPAHHTPFDEEDFEIMAEWGFNFARIPLSYWCWSKENDWYEVDEKCLKEIDRAVELGKQYNIHINLNFHRAPGYCINPPFEKSNLFEDEEPLEACAFHWKLFAERYSGCSPDDLSFNLINEAPYIADEKYDKVVRRLIKTIRDVSADRTIIVDGLDVGGRPLMSLTDEKNIIQSGRGYQPMLISHYGANWVYGDGPMQFPKEQLSWPLREDDKLYDREWMRMTLKKNWDPWIAQNGKIHIGEFGCHNQTPHAVALAWLNDLMQVFEENRWGWALWNLKGSFGVLDSGRKDVAYENFKNHKLDRRMLELLQIWGPHSVR